MLDHTPTQPKTKEIPLTQGKVAIVDAADYEWLMQWKWCAQRSPTGEWYAVRSHSDANGKQRGIKMHRFILSAPDGVEVDHRNRDGLDNRRDNLRIATAGQNKCNQGRRKDNASGFKGVTWEKRSGKWRPQLRVDGKSIYLGLFDDLIKAANAYDMAAIEHHGEFAVLNFPEAPR